MVAPLSPFVRAKLRDQTGVTDEQLDEYQSLIEERAYSPRGNVPDYAVERRDARLRELAALINPKLGS